MSILLILTKTIDLNTWRGAVHQPDSHTAPFSDVLLLSNLLLVDMCHGY